MHCYVALSNQIFMDFVRFLNNVNLGSYSYMRDVWGIIFAAP